jgi:Zn-dependent protease
LEQKFVDFAIQYSVLLFALSFHESAHAWSALKFGDPTARDLGRISLNPLRHIDPIGTFLLPILFFIGAGHFMFGWAKPTPVNLSRTPNPRKANLVVSGAGPVSNLLLCVIGVLFLVVVRRLPITGSASTTVLEPLWEILVSFTMVNFGLGIFNLLPIPPLDGSHVFASIAGGRVGMALESANPMLGFGILMLLIYTGLLNRILTPFFIAFRTVLATLLA